jgi:hypothetical protein
VAFEMKRRRDVAPVLDFLRKKGIGSEVREGSKHLLLIISVNGRRHMLPFSRNGEADQWTQKKKLADLKRILGV